ncbi:MAG: hypothetical protein LIO92_07005 [Clostridiales bacterium]|nr:hypothetical protein [Clostridiales bacterium]
MKKAILIATILASALICIPVQAEESTVIQSGALTQDEQTQAFLDAYSADLDALIELCNGDSYSAVTDYMVTIGYTNITDNLPYYGFCYPTTDGEGLKIMSDYLYYGTLVNGDADGQGKMYKADIPGQYNYGCFSGEWKNDAPNGYGEEQINTTGNSGKEAIIHVAGNYVDWYQDGDMVIQYFKNNGCRTYKYHVTDKVADAIDTKVTSHGNTAVIAYAEEKSSSFLTFYNSAQTVLHQAIDDGNSKNNHGYWNTGL